MACLYVLEDVLGKFRIDADNCIFVVEAEFALAHFVKAGCYLGKIAVGLIICKLHDGGEDLNWKNTFATPDTLVRCGSEEMHQGYETWVGSIALIDLQIKMLLFLNRVIICIRHIVVAFLVNILLSILTRAIIGTRPTEMLRRMVILVNILLFISVVSSSIQTVL